MTLKYDTDYFPLILEFCRAHECSFELEYTEVEDVFTFKVTDQSGFGYFIKRISDFKYIYEKMKSEYVEFYDQVQFEGGFGTVSHCKIENNSITFITGTVYNCTGRVKYKGKVLLECANVSQSFKNFQVICIPIL